MTRQFLGDRLQNASTYAVGPLSLLFLLSVCLCVWDVGVLWWPNGWMDQDETWHGVGRGLGPGHIVSDEDPAPLQRGTVPRFLAHVCCGQTAGWIQMPLGTQVGLCPGDIVLDGGPRSRLKKCTPPTFLPMSIVAKQWIDQDASWYEGRPQPRPHCVR